MSKKGDTKAPPPPPPPAARPQRKIGVEEEDIVLGGELENEDNLRRGKSSLVRPSSGKGATRKPSGSGLKV